ncbi:phosphomannose isomerase type II C-terminal cupin domain [Patescibacteria group bacterium]
MKKNKITVKNFSQTTEHRPWGSFTILLDSKDCKVKKIVVKPGQRLSLQRHCHREELWQIVSGKGIMTLGCDVFSVTAGSVFVIEKQDIHRIENNGTKNLVFVEVQTGTYFGEDDIERLKDDYDRIAQNHKGGD